MWRVEEYVRNDGSIPYRIYLARDWGKVIVLLGGGTKRRQQTDIDRAKALLAEYKARRAR